MVRRSLRDLQAATLADIPKSMRRSVASDLRAVLDATDLVDPELEPRGALMRNGVAAVERALQQG